MAVAARAQSASLCVSLVALPFAMLAAVAAGASRSAWSRSAGGSGIGADGELATPAEQPPPP